MHFASVSSQLRDTHEVAYVSCGLRCLVLAMLLINCTPSQPDTLRVERVLVDQAIGRFEPFDQTITDAAGVKQIHDTLLALPAAPSGQNEPFCPIAWGLRYRPTFARAAAPLGVVVIEADGCRYAYLGATDRRATTESFWAQLAGGLGFYTRGNDLFPMPKDQ